MRAVKAVRDFFKEVYKDGGALDCALVVGFCLAICAMVVFIVYCPIHAIADAIEIRDRQGTYAIEDDSEFHVYADDERYEYWVDPVSGYVNLRERKSSVTTNMTEEEFFKSLEDRGFVLYGEESEAKEKDGVA